MTLCELYGELKGWQSMIGSILGFAALTWGALYNYKLNRRRDDETRAKEALSVALGLYSEITLISKELVHLANSVGRWYLRTGISGGGLPAHFTESFVLPEATLFKALASKVGLLSPDILMPVARFYGYYGEAVTHFPHIVEDQDRKVGYGVEWVLDPAISAIDAVQSALREIERIGGISEPATMADLKTAREALALERDMRD